jgi:hypothetical protein
MSKLSSYLEYAEGMGATQRVVGWLNSTLKNYLQDNEPSISEVEHVIDYLVQNEVAKINQMSYPQAVKKAEAWTLKLQKQAEKIAELPGDTETVLDFNDGFRIVRLVGKNAYEREGKLMRHCVASYYGREAKIYSLRDENNNPHATLEEDNQIKGKGNGSIHPKYIGYVVKFLEYTGMDVRDSEMLNLGYVNVERYKKYLKKDQGLFQGKYWYKENQLLDKDGGEFASLELLDQVPLIDDRTLKINFKLESFVKLSIDFLFKQNRSKVSNGQSEKISSKADSAQVASSGYSAKVASSGDYAQVASSGYSAKVASSGDYAQVASSGDSAKVASSGYSAKVASSGDSAQVASSGDSAKVASSGDYAKVASSGWRNWLDVTGENSVAAAIGKYGKIRAKKGTWITLAEYDDEGKPLCVKSAQIDGKKLKENVWYELKGGEFNEVES